MAIIRSMCSEHGDIETISDDVLVRVCVDTGEGAYVVRCPEGGPDGNGHPFSKPAEPHVIELLIASGCRLDRWRLPAELAETKDGPAIDHDDLLDFHRLLTDDIRLTAELGRLADGGDDPFGDINHA